MSLPLSEREGEICDQVANLLQSKDGTAHLIGMIGSLVSNQMVQMEYMNVIAECLNGICELGRMPINIITFYDFIETHDFNDDQRKEWLKNKMIERQKAYQEALKKRSGLVDASGKKI